MKALGENQYLNHFLSNSKNLESFISFIRHQLKKYRLSKYEPEEIFSDVFIRLSDKNIPDKISSIEDLTKWLRVVAHNRIIDILRREIREAQLKTSFEGISVADSSPTLDSSDTRHLLLQSALQSLSSEDRELLEMRYVDEMSWSEIAYKLEQEGRTTSAISLRQRGSRAIKRLRGWYELHGL